MKKTVIVFLAALVPLLSVGQSNLGKTDDLGRIALAAIVPDAAEVPDNARNMLQNKLQQIAVQNGLGATESQGQFAIVPMISIVSKEVTPTAPPMQALNLDISFYIVDGQSQNIFSQTTISVKGVGKTEDAAYTQGIKNINPKHGQFKGFVEKGKEKIVEYYNSQCDVIIKGSQALAGQKKYEEALYMLLSVPDVSRECFDKCMGISMDIYKQYADQKCSENLSAAKAAWAGKELNRVEENLSKITPDMACYPEAQQLVDQITKAVEAEGASAWTYKMKVYDDTVEKEKMMIQAGKEVAMSWAHWGAAQHFNWDWRFLYPNAKAPVKQPESVEKIAQPEKSAAKTEATAPKPEPTNKLGVLTAKVSAYNGNFKGNYHLLADGDFASNGSVRTNAKSVYWDDPKDVYFVLDLGEVRQINGFNISNHNTDTYVLEWSVDGEKFHYLSTIENSWGRVEGYSDYRMETFSTNPNHKGYEPRIKFAPVQARYIKVYATQCKYCSLSEVQLLGF